VKPSDRGLDKHAQNFVEAIRANNPSMVNCSIQEGAHVATVAQMGNISYRSGDKLYWDAAKKGLLIPLLMINTSQIPIIMGMHYP